MPKVVKSRAIACFHFSLRWSVAHTPQNLNTLRKYIRRKCDKFIFQAEDTENNPHYQGYIHVKTKVRAKALACVMNSTLLGVEIRPSSNEGKEALQDYCMKDDTRVDGPWADKRLYLGKDLWTTEKMPKWQKQLLPVLMGEPDDRTMYWIYDPVGLNGKTKFCKYLVYKHDAVGLVYGHAGDILNLVSKMPNRNIYAWNLTRAKPKDLSELDLYAAMESVKDGFFVNLKYETKQVLMNPPHVIVFSNHLPKREFISADRWKIYKLENSEISLI